MEMEKKEVGKIYSKFSESKRTLEFDNLIEKYSKRQDSEDEEMFDEAEPEMYLNDAMEKQNIDFSEFHLATPTSNNGQSGAFNCDMHFKTDFSGLLSNQKPSCNKDKKIPFSIARTNGLISKISIESAAQANTGALPVSKKQKTAFQVTNH